MWINDLFNHYNLPFPPSIKPEGFTRWGKNNRYYMLLLKKSDLEGVFVGDFVTGETITAFNREPEKHEKRLVKQYIDHKQRELQASQAEKIKSLWARAAHYTDHPYFKRKQLFSSEGLRQLPLTPKYPSSLIIPIYGGFSATPQGLQFIYEDGSKKFMTGSILKAGFFVCGNPAPESLIYIAEGYATAATVAMVTGKPCVCAFNAGNLPPVTKYFFDNGYKQIAIAADNDEAGLTSAAKCRPMARFIFYPPDDNDFSDVYLRLGTEACRKLLAALH